MGRYLNPPWMSLEEALDVAPPKSPASTRATLSPAPAASYATRLPTMPAPITSRSKLLPSSRSHAAARCLIIRTSGHPKPIEAQPTSMPPIQPPTQGERASPSGGLEARPPAGDRQLIGSRGEDREEPVGPGLSLAAGHL